MMIPMILIVVGAILQASFIMVEHKEKYVAADILKGSASLCFVLVGLYGFTHGQNGREEMKMVLGLLFGMLGDILLNLRYVFKKYDQKFFLSGIVVFFIGHLFYLAAFLSQSGVRVITLACVIGGALTVGLLAYIFTHMKVKKVFKIFGVFYLGAVDIMMVAAVLQAVLLPYTPYVLCGIGAVAFMLSDAILIFYIFGDKHTYPMRIANLSIYYLGQALIALSLQFYVLF